MNIWIVKSHSGIYGDVFLAEYAHQSECGVYDKIARKGREQGKRGTGKSIAKKLGWKVVECSLVEVQSKPPNAERQGRSEATYPERSCSQIHSGGNAHE